MRKHGEPSPRAMKEFLEIAGKLGYAEIDASSSFSLQKSFDLIQDENAKMILKHLCIKPMQRAKYYCTGVEDILHFHHYALACPLYTHFTSPIRRYCDLVVHRLLDAALTNVKPEELPTLLQMDTSKVADIAKHCNVRKESSKNAQDDSQKAYLCAYLHKLSLESNDLIEEAFVFKISSRSFDVLVPKYGLERRIYVEDLIDSSVAHGCGFDNATGTLKIFWKSSKLAGNIEQQMTNLSLDGEEAAGTQDASMQRIKVFDKVLVRIQVMNSRTPWDVKLFAVPPFTERFTLKNVVNPSFGSDSICLAIIDEAD